MVCAPARRHVQQGPAFVRRVRRSVKAEAAQCAHADPDGAVEVRARDVVERAVHVVYVDDVVHEERVVQVKGEGGVRAAVHVSRSASVEVEHRGSRVRVAVLRGPARPEADPPAVPVQVAAVGVRA